MGLPAPVPERLILDAPSALVELRVDEPADVEGVGDQGRGGRHHLEHLAVGTGQVEGAEADPSPERVSSLGQPGHGLDTAPARDDVEELATAYVDELGREVLAVTGADPRHEDLVEPQGGDIADALGVGGEEGFAAGDDGVVHGVPVAAEKSPIPATMDFAASRSIWRVVRRCCPSMIERD